MDLKVLQLYKVLPAFANFLKISMKEWKTNLDLSQTQSNTTCKNLKTKCGIFQVDSLSSLLFCLAFIPLSFKLNETEYRYYFYELRINYQFYIDDLKLQGKVMKNVKGYSVL